MQFKTQGNLLQLKDDYVKNVTVTNVTTTVNTGNHESTEYTSDVNI